MYILRLLGLFSIILAVALIVPLIVVVAYGEADMSVSFIVPAAMCGLLGVLLLLVVRKKEYSISIHGGFLFTTLCWLYAAIVGAIPFVLSGTIPDFSSAFFESMSGFSTTGASVLIDIESLPYAILFWRSFTHWLGGMGIIVLLVSVLPLISNGGQRLFSAEVTGLGVDRTVPNIGKSAKILWITYCIFTVMEVVLLRVFGMSLFDATTHAFGTMATGGFSTRSASVGAFQSDSITTIITIFMILAGINFNIYFRLINKKNVSVLRDPEFRAYFLIIAAATTIVLMQLLRHGDGSASLYNRAITALFQVVAFITTTGYVTENFNIWPIAAQGVLFLLMFCGACSGSTGGGVKIIRLLLMGKQGIREMKYALHPRGVFSSQLRGATPEHKTAIKMVSGFISLYLILIASTFLLLAMSGYDLLTSLTTALSALGNIGPGFGRIGATENYAHFSAGIKYYLSFIMMCGRLELFTVLVLFMPRFWRRGIR